MYVTELATNKKHQVKVRLVDQGDYKYITKARYYFNWKAENEVYKLVLKEEILGLMSCIHYKIEQRIEIKLLAVSKDNRGAGKIYARVAGTLIGFACREVVKNYGSEGCVSLVPKTQLKQYYMDYYGMLSAGQQVFLAGQPLLDLLKEYEL